MAAHGNSQARWDAQSLSLTLGRIAGIRIRLHLFFLVFVALELLRYYAANGMVGVFRYALPLSLILWLLVLLHELGHCFGCRSVGGRADDVVLWPLGGLAFCDPPHRPMENLVTTLAGPAVNVAILIVLTPILWLCDALSGSLWHPFVFWGSIQATDNLGLYLALAWKLNYWLMLFNLALPIYPFDGGRVLQEVLWFRLDYFRATMIATTVGLIGGVALAGLGIYVAGAVSKEYFLLAGIGLFAIFESFRLRQELEFRGAGVGEFGYDFSQGYTSLERTASGDKKRLRLWERFRAWSEKRQKEQAVRMELELDRILDKIHREGIDSLTRLEKRTLAQASKNRRQRKA